MSLATLLVRPVGLFAELYSSTELVAVSKEKYGLVRRAYVVCGRDNVLKQGFQEWMIENSPTDEVEVISSADHMVMFSKAQELCACLLDLAVKYC